MPRKSTRYMAATVADAVNVLLSGAPEAMTEWNRSGNERADLTRHFHEINPACIVCGEWTVLSGFKGEGVAVLFHIVPPSCVPGMGRIRGGYIGGGVALACRACADATGAYVKSGGVWDDSILSCLSLSDVPTEWPALNRTYRLSESDSEVTYAARSSRGHAERAREARRERGLPF